MRGAYGPLRARPPASAAPRGAPRAARFRCPLPLPAPAPRVSRPVVRPAARMTRSRLALVAGAVAIVSLGAMWGGLHARLRLAFWDRIATRALTEEDRSALAACEGGWWAVVKVLEQDVEAPCGEPWLVERVAAQVKGSKDRVAWLAARTAGSVRSRQFRAALILAAAGESTPVEPAVLLAQTRDELPANRLSELLLAAGEGAAWADALG